MSRRTCWLFISVALLAFSCSREDSPQKPDLEKKPAAGAQSSEQKEASKMAGADLKEHRQLFPVMQSKKWGYIDRTGKIVIEPQWYAASEFCDGLARVMPAGKYECKGFGYGPPWGYVNRKGKLVIPAEFNQASEFSEGLARVSTGNWRVHGFHFGEGSPYGYIDTSGSMVIKEQFREARSFSEGLAAVTVWTGPEHRHKWGFIDKKGNEVIKPRFEMAYSFKEGLATVKVDGKWGYVDKNGEMVIKMQFDAARSFSERFAAVMVGEKWGFINKKGKLVIEPHFDGARGFSEGLAAVNMGGTTKVAHEPVVTLAGQWGYIDKTGKTTVKPRFDDTGPFSEGLAAVNVGGKRIKEYTPQGYYVVITLGGKWGFVEKGGKTVIEPKFACALSFSGGLAVVSNSRNVLKGLPEQLCDSFGYIVTAGVVELLYRQFCYIDKTGKYVWKPTK